MEILKATLLAIVLLQLGAVNNASQTFNFTALPVDVLKELSQGGSTFLQNLYATKYAALREKREATLTEEGKCKAKSLQLRRELEERNTAKLQNQCTPCIDQKCSAFAQSCGTASYSAGFIGNRANDVVQFFDNTVGELITGNVISGDLLSIADVAVGDIGAFITNDVSGFFTEDLGDALSGLGDIFDDVGDFFTNDKILNFIDDKILGKIEGFGKDVFSGLVDFGENVGDFVGDITGDIEDFFIDVGDFALNLGSVMDCAFDSLFSASLGALGNELEDTFTDLGKEIEDIFSGKRRRRQVSAPSCSQMSNEQTRNAACLYFTNECPCKLETFEFNALKDCPTYAAQKKSYQNFAKSNAALLALIPENLKVKFTSGKVNVNNKISENIYMGHFDVTVAGKKYSMQQKIGLTPETLKQTMPAVLKSAVKMAI